jgi:hypothetical protein
MLSFLFVYAILRDRFFLFPGQGKYEGMVGALLAELANGKHIRIGSGLNDEQRKQPPPIGSIITLRYRQLTKDGLPRFPSFVAVRDDLTATWPPSPSANPDLFMLPSQPPVSAPPVSADPQPSVGAKPRKRKLKPRKTKKDPDAATSQPASPVAAPPASS